MKESYDEGIANHIGPESCVGLPQGGGEALAGVRAGRVLSCEILLNFRVPTFWDRWKATSGVSLTQDTTGPCAVGDLEHVRKLLTREPGDPMSAWGEGVPSGRLGKSKDVSR